MTTSKRSAGAAASASPAPIGDLGKMLEQFKLPGVDTSALAEWQRKDLEALAEAQRQAYEGLKALVERRNEMLRETFSQWQESATNATGEDFLARQRELVKQGVEQAIANFRELSAMEAESRGNAWKVVQDRMQENMANLQKLLQPK